MDFKAGDIVVVKDDAPVAPALRGMKGRSLKSSRTARSAYAVMAAATMNGSTPPACGMNRGVSA